MSFSLRRRIRRSGDHVVVKIDSEERSLLGHLIPQLHEVLVGVAQTGDVDDAVRRLFPAAHATDPDLEAEFQQSQRDRLLAARLDRLDLVEGSLQSEKLTDEQHQAWIASVNDLRLVLGTRLDVSEDDDLDGLDPDDPNAGAVATYHYLGHLLGELIDAVDLS